MFSRFVVAIALLFLSTTNSAQARIWSSADGHSKLEADLIASSKETVVLKRPTGELVAIELAELAEGDREFVASKATADKLQKSAEEMQTWTGAGGLKVRGRVLAFGRKVVTVQRKNGKMWVNDKLFSTLDGLHQKVILKIVSALEETELTDERQFTDWGKKIGGAPKSYTLEGVMMKLESGDEIGVPFFLFAKDDLEILKPGWERWLESEDEQSYRDQESFLVRSAAMAYQQDRAAKKQIELLKLNLLGAATGVIDIWQVGLRPGPQTYGRPMSVMVSAQNSAQATQIALQQHPGFVVYGVRRASN